MIQRINDNVCISSLLMAQLPVSMFSKYGETFAFIYDHVCGNQKYVSGIFTQLQLTS